MNGFAHAETIVMENGSAFMKKPSDAFRRPTAEDEAIQGLCASSMQAAADPGEMPASLDRPDADEKVIQPQGIDVAFHKGQTD